jgi:hypothetical protein
MGLFDLFKKPDPAAQAEHEAALRRQADILMSLRGGRVPTGTEQRLQAARAGRLPWLATLTPAELMVARSHGLKPIAAVSATCWLHYGWSWTLGHAEGWGMALQRLKAEARACGANAVLDVKMRTIPLGIASSMDFTLVGTAVYVDGLPASDDPIVATVPALEFVKLLEADVVPTGIAIGAHYEWMADWRGNANMSWMGNTESRALSGLWETVRQRRSGPFELFPDVRAGGWREPAQAISGPAYRDRDDGGCQARHAVCARDQDRGGHARRRHAADRHDAPPPILCDQ